MIVIIVNIITHEGQFCKGFEHHSKALESVLLSILMKRLKRIIHLIYSMLSKMFVRQSTQSYQLLSQKRKNFLVSYVINQKKNNIDLSDEIKKPSTKVSEAKSNTKLVQEAENAIIPTEL